jgi:hypothetical protein
MGIIKFFMVVLVSGSLIQEDLATVSRYNTNYQISRPEFGEVGPA